MNSQPVSSLPDLLSACRAISAAAAIHRTAGFEQADALGVNQGSSSLFLIAELTCSCIACGGLAEEIQGAWIWEITDLLLDAWVELLAEDSFSPKHR